MFEPDDIVSVYTRAQALADGFMVDLSAWGGEGMIGGFTVPVHVSSAVWAMIEAIPESKKGIQDVRGRAHDVLFLAQTRLRLYAQAHGGEVTLGEVYDFQVTLPSKGTRKQKRQLFVSLTQEVMDDDGRLEVCATIMLKEDL